ncbi:MAG: DUF5615 family PIN-like protein [Chloroflexi bacterium]|nr:DUF5615 family PIN-like protein [Chloroflexota bacterium]MBI3763775.1 DUF5615 family PIN-like protein [Chloroflexota bacterium]
MKFLANMGISPVTVDWLRSQGHEAVHLHEEELDQLADSEIMDKARREERIVLTSDLDFGDLLAASREQLPSVIIFRLRNMRPENVHRHLFQVIEHHADELEKGVVVSITEDQLRVRRLPISSEV